MLCQQIGDFASVVFKGTSQKRPGKRPSPTQGKREATTFTTVESGLGSTKSVQTKGTTDRKTGYKALQLVL
jgi:hypothetical protein